MLFFKFLLKSSEAIVFLNHLYNEYDLIANNEIMIRSYETKYFDTYQRDTFLMHHNGKFPRYKIRTRTYLDTNDQFVEVKFKNNKGLTEKYRNKLSEVDNLFMQPDVISFLKNFPKDKEIFIIGGKIIYDITLDVADRLYITHVKKAYDGNVYFKDIDYSKYNVISKQDSGDLTFTIYERNHLTCP